ncbi:MAG: zinc-dependent alcohol dehydrogenase [Myxococcota bacterium]
MRVTAAQAPGVFAVEERPLPEPEPGQARVRLLACGICGTDLHFHHAGLFAPGHVPGHEMFGEVDALGDGVAGVAGVAVGDRVAVEPIEACGRCPACREGRGNICPENRLFGIHLPGGFAEAICVPAERLFPVADAVSPEIAALAEPTAVAVHGVRRGGVGRGDRVLVLGAGTIGLLSVLAARDAGAGEVWLTARHPHQAELGAALGAARVLGEDEGGPEALDRLGREAPIDCVVETVGGNADTLHAAVAAIRPGGTVSVVGVFLGDVAVPGFPLLLKEGVLAWSNCYQHAGRGSDFADAVDLLTRERDALAALTRASVPLDQVARGFELASDKKAGAVKVTVRPDGS